jgi:hypothetical protein
MSPGAHIRCLTAACLFVASGCASLGPPRHPEFKTLHSQIRSVAVLPPSVEVYKFTFKGEREMIYDLLPGLRQQAAAELEQVLAKRGYQVQPLDLSEQALNDDPELKRTLHTIQELFEKRIEEYSKKWFPTAHEFRYSVGSDINVFADRAKSDALVFVRCQGIKKSGGEIAKDFAKTLLLAVATLGNAVVYYYPSVTVVQMGVIDGDTGELLWYHQNFGQGNFDIAREKRFRKELRAMISKFPKAVSTKASSKRAEAPPSTLPGGGVSIPIAR